MLNVWLIGLWARKQCFDWAKATKAWITVVFFRYGITSM